MKNILWISAVALFASCSADEKPTNEQKKDQEILEEWGPRGDKDEQDTKNPKDLGNEDSGDSSSSERDN